jgi:hypothetical protein
MKIDLEKLCDRAIADTDNTIFKSSPLLDKLFPPLTPAQQRATDARDRRNHREWLKTHWKHNCGSWNLSGTHGDTDTQFYDEIDSYTITFCPNCGKSIKSLSKKPRAKK